MYAIALRCPWHLHRHLLSLSLSHYQYVFVVLNAVDCNPTSRFSLIRVRFKPLRAPISLRPRSLLFLLEVPWWPCDHLSVLHWLSFQMWTCFWTTEGIVGRSGASEEMPHSHAGAQRIVSGNFSPVVSSVNKIWIHHIYIYVYMR